LDGGGVGGWEGGLSIHLGDRGLPKRQVIKIKIKHDGLLKALMNKKTN